MGALRILLLAVLLATAPVLAQPDTGLISDPANQALEEGTAAAENGTGEDLTSEEIDLSLELDVVNAEFDVVGILFGGGKVQTDVEAHASLAFYAANVSRAETALAQATGDENATLEKTLGIHTNRTVMTADAIRSAGGGLLLEAFQSVQEDAAEDYVQDALPQVTVLYTSFSWSNTEPGQDVEDEGEIEDEEDVDAGDPREPPIVLDATMTLRFLDRIALGDLLQSNAEDEDEDAQTLVAAGQEPNETETDPEEVIRANHQPPLLDRDAFQVLGIDQVLDLDLPPGWRLNLTLTVPEGYTIEGTSDALTVDDDRESVTYYVDGSQREESRETSGLVTLSNRGLVTLTVILAVALLALPARYLVEAATFATRRRWL